MEQRNPLKAEDKFFAHDSFEFSKEFLFKPQLESEAVIHHSDLFQKQGEKLLLDGDHLALRYFDIALDLDPSNPHLLYEQGMALLESGSEKGREKHLFLACQRLKKATRIDPSHTDSWFVWGQALFQLGTLYGKIHFFIEAKEKLDKAIQLVHRLEHDLSGDIYWLHGCTTLEVAHNSQEVSDINIALESFSLAVEKNPSLPPSFWIDFGEAYERLGMQINDGRLISKSVDCYKKAVHLQGDNANHWHLLGKALHNFYFFSQDEDHFTQATECFSTSAQLNPDDYNVWICWAKALFDSGKKNGEAKKFFSCIEKLHRANSCFPKNASIISLWSEALATVGLLLDRLDLIQDAENKILEMIDSPQAGPEVWHAFGMCYFTYGQYYQSAEYYMEAIEKFQYGLSLDRTYHPLWYALGLCYTHTAELENDHENLRLSCKFFTRALHHASKSHYHFEYALTLSKLGSYLEDIPSLELALYHFEQALSLHKQATNLPSAWLYQYAVALDLLADLKENGDLYTKSIEILHHVLILDPSHPHVHYRLGSCYFHYAELTEDPEFFLRATHHFKLAYRKDDENEQILLDWALALISLSELYDTPLEKGQLLKEAEYKMIQAVKLGNAHAYYNLACLYSLVHDFQRSMFFLDKAKEFSGLPSIDEMLHDTWLENLRHTTAFHEFITQIENANP